MRIAALVAGLAATVFAGNASAAAPRTADIVKGPLAETIDRQLTAAAEQGFNGAVIVEIRGQTVLKAGYGYADRQAGTPFTARTPAQIGSITKTFTALAVSRLAAAGKVDLHAPVRTWLPGIAEPGGSATLHQLMTHTAGLDDYCGDDFDSRTQAELLNVCMARPLAHPVGTSAYSNMGVSVAAAVVEEVSGKPWEVYLRDRVWRPYGMTRTGWTFPSRKGHAVGYLDGKDNGVISERIAALKGADWNLKGNGGLQAAAEDMQRFDHGLKREPAAVSALMDKPRADGNAPDVKEGYGRFFRLDKAGKPYRIGHGGSDGVFFAYFATLPQQDVFFYFVGSNGEDPVRKELNKVLKAVQDAVGAGPGTPAQTPAPAAAKAN